MTVPWSSVRKAALVKDPEVSARAIRILKAWFNSEGEETHEAALQALRQIAQSQEIVTAASAQAVLAPAAETLAWIKQVGGDVTMDETGREPRLVELNLDRARGVDPGFYADSLQDSDLARLRPLRDLRALTLENRTTMTDAGLEHLSALKQLAALNLSRTSLSGSGLKHLANLPRLRSLNLGSCSALRDDALQALGSSKSLRILILDGTSNAWCHDELWMMSLRFPGRDQLRQYRGGVSDAGLQQLSQLRELTSLSLVRTQITDEGLPALQPLRQLESLDLSRTAITGAGLAHVGSLDHLKVLKLNFTPVADEGLRKLKGIHNLEELQLRGCVITDAGLAELRGFTKLRALDLYGTAITDAAIDVFQDLPNLDTLQLGQTQISFRGLQKLGQVSAHFRLEDALLAGELAEAGAHREIVSVI